MKQATHNPVSRKTLPEPSRYVRTKEDEEQDRLEQQWKAERNNRARAEFMRRYPTGRIPLFS